VLSRNTLNISTRSSWLEIWLFLSPQTPGHFIDRALSAQSVLLVPNGTPVQICKSGKGYILYLVSKKRKQKHNRRLLWRVRYLSPPKAFPALASASFHFQNISDSKSPIARLLKTACKKSTRGIQKVDLTNSLN